LPVPFPEEDFESLDFVGEDFDSVDFESVDFDSLVLDSVDFESPPPDFSSDFEELLSPDFSLDPEGTFFFP
jgi:hypothetical protein